MGCTSELGGNSGVLWIVESQADLDHILKYGPTPPYAVVMTRSHYTRQNLLAFRDHLDRVAGVILIDKHDTDSQQRQVAFSPEDTCPNRYSGLYVNDTSFQGCKKNSWIKESQVSGLLYDDLPYPIFFMKEKKSVEELTSCFKDNNLVKDSSKREQDMYPLCSVQLDSFMLAASNTKACLSSHSLVDELLQTNGIRCATVENQNIFAYFKPTRGFVTPAADDKYVLPSTLDPQTTVLVVAKLSSLSMFSEISPGADSTISSIITLLAVSEALGKVRKSDAVTRSKRNIAFALLDSEPFDYTGSSRMVATMASNTFPNPMFRRKNLNITETVQNINLTSIDFIIDLDQLANYPHSNQLFLHSDPNEKSGAEKLKKLRNVLSEAAKSADLSLKLDDTSMPIPPSPVQEFIRRSRSQNTDKNLLGVVLSNYEQNFNNLFYHSIYDDRDNIFQSSREKLAEHLTKVATFLARGIYELAFDNENTDEIKADSSTIDELLTCYLIDANCDLFTKVWQAGQKLPEGPVQTYNDPTRQSDDMNGAITTHLLSYFLSDKYPELNSSRCAQENEKSYIFNYQYINGKNTVDSQSGLCIASQVFNTRSDSPAFEITEDGLRINPEYPAWTISFSSIRHPVRIYLEPSLLHQWALVCLGLVITVVSFLTVHQFRDSISKMEGVMNSQPVTST